MKLILTYFIFFHLMFCLFGLRFFYATNHQGNIGHSLFKPDNFAKLEQIQPLLVKAVVASEDYLFWKHYGIDWEQLFGVVEDNVEKLRFTRGASTISQQLIKNYFFDSKKSVVRKIFEIILTLEMELITPKKIILEQYLNIIEFGPNIFGIHQASLYYFKKTPAQINLGESLFLISLLPSPLKYGRGFHQRGLSRGARNRMLKVGQRLVWAGQISVGQKFGAVSNFFQKWQ
jgi:membrane peptidoglycan carboxypeptidase